MIGSMGPVLGLLIALFLIAKKLPPVWSLLIGAAAGGLLGGGDFFGTASVMLSGSIGMLSSAACVLASGVLAGALIGTGAAERIAASVLHYLGQRWAMLGIACCVLLLTAAGVFVDIAVMTAAPIALAIGRKTGYSGSAVLLAMVGGGKAGNIISPNPNTIAAAKAFGLELTSVMAVNLLPALCALLVTVLLASGMNRTVGAAAAEERAESDLPPLWAAVSGPAAVLILLGLRPVFGIAVDPVIALPVGGAVCVLLTGRGRDSLTFLRYGMKEVVPIALLLLGTGALSGVIEASNLRLDAVAALNWLHLPAFVLAPASGILMGGAAASTTAGTAIAGQTFSPVLVDAGVGPLSAAAMIHAGATVLDSLPHGSFFHATAGCTNLDTRTRLRLIPAEALIGLTSTAAAAAMALLHG